MENFMRIFAEKNGDFSWRKGLTALAGLIFTCACIGFLFGAPELPTQYQAIIAGVFAFYFFKDKMRDAKANQP